MKWGGGGIRKTEMKWERSEKEVFGHSPRGGQLPVETNW